MRRRVSGGPTGALLPRGSALEYPPECFEVTCPEPAQRRRRRARRPRQTGRRAARTGPCARGQRYGPRRSDARPPRQGGDEAGLWTAADTRRSRSARKGGRSVSPRMRGSERSSATRLRWTRLKRGGRWPHHARFRLAERSREVLCTPRLDVVPSGRLSSTLETPASAAERRRSFEVVGSSARSVGWPTKPPRHRPRVEPRLARAGAWAAGGGRRRRRRRRRRACGWRRASGRAASRRRSPRRRCGVP